MCFNNTFASIYYLHIGKTSRSCILDFPRGHFRLRSAAGRMVTDNDCDSSGQRTLVWNKWHRSRNRCQASPSIWSDTPVNWDCDCPIR